MISVHLALVMIGATHLCCAPKISSAECSLGYAVFRLGSPPVLAHEYQLNLDAPNCLKGC